MDSERGWGKLKVFLRLQSGCGTEIKALMGSAASVIASRKAVPSELAQTVYIASMEVLYNLLMLTTA